MRKVFMNLKNASSAYRYYVYALFCDPGEGDGYVKIGMSSNIGKRVTALRMNCPIPAKYIALLEVEDRQKAVDVERALHVQFSQRKTKGEWFRFNFASKQDKYDFNLGCQIVFNRMLSIFDQQQWEKVNLEAIDKDHAVLQALLHRPGIGKRIRRKQEYVERQKQAWRELNSRWSPV